MPLRHNNVSFKHFACRWCRCEGIAFSRSRYSVLPATKHAILSLMLLCTWHYFICMILRTLTRHFGTDEPKLKLDSASTNLPRMSASNHLKIPLITSRVRIIRIFSFSSMYERTFDGRLRNDVTAVKGKKFQLWRCRDRVTCLLSSRR